MRVSGINNIVSFGKNMQMAIPTDINKITNPVKTQDYPPTFGSLAVKPVTVPIYDTFVQVFK